MIRLILLLLFLTLFFIVTIPVVLVVLVIGLFNKHTRDVISFYFIKFALKVSLVISGVSVTTNGLENIPSDRPVLFIGNHTSYFDIVTSYTILPHLTGFVAKKELMRIPGLNWWMVLMNCLFLDREEPRKAIDTINKASDLVKSGISIFIFPEGTRMKGGELGEFKEGSFKIATKSNCPVVPVALTGTADIFENHFPVIRPGKVTITFGEPIDTASLSRVERKQLGVMTRTKVKELLNSDGCK